jgi:hypothetical protein
MVRVIEETGFFADADQGADVVEEVDEEEDEDDLGETEAPGGFEVAVTTALKGMPAS